MPVPFRFLVTVGLICAAPLAAQSRNQTVDPAKMSAEQLREAAQRGDADRGSACRSLIYSNDLERLEPNVANRGLAVRLRGTCAWSRKQYAAAQRDLEAAEGLLDRTAAPKLRASIDYMLVWSAAELKNSARVEAHALHVARRNDADEFADADIGVWRYAMQQTDVDARGRIALVFARASSFSRLDERMQSMMGYQAIRPALAAGDTKLAFAFATREPDPDSMVAMLIDRAYAPIWPQLERHVGPGLAKELAANLAKAERELAAAPDDLAKLSAVVRAQLWLNRPAEAAAVAQRADHSTEAFSEASEQFGWLINAEVDALDMLQQDDRADELFDRLVARGAGQQRPWMVNFAINRADRLIEQGRWAEALPAAEIAVDIAAEFGSPYAKEVAAVDRYCAAIKLDPARVELAAWWQEIEAGRLANIGSAVQAAQCKGDHAAAKRFYREALNDPEAREQALSLMQPRATDQHRDEGNMFAEPRLIFQTDPTLVALFARYGRILPTELEPAPYRP